MEFFNKYRLSRLVTLMTLFCILMTISAVSAAGEDNSNHMNGTGGANDTAFMMNRTIEMIDSTTKSLENMKMEANDTTIESINDYLAKLESIRSNVENSNSTEALTTQKTSLDDLFKSMNEKLGFKLPTNETRPEMPGMGNQTGPGPSQQSGMGNQTAPGPSQPGMGNQSNGQNKTMGNGSGMVDGPGEKTGKIQDSSDSSGIFEKIIGFFESLFK